MPLLFAIMSQAEVSFKPKIKASQSQHHTAKKVQLVTLWPWKPFQQFARTWWIFVTSFIDVPLSTEIL